MENEGFRDTIRLAAVCGLCMRMDDGPTIANTAERVVEAVAERVRTGKQIDRTFGKEGEMEVSVVNGQRVAAPAAGGLGNAPVDAQQLVNALAQLLAGQRSAAPPAAPASPTPPPFGGTPVDVGTPVSATQSAPPAR